jgi:hypothetical protein
MPALRTWMVGSTMKTAGAERRAGALWLWAAVTLLVSTAFAGCVGPGLEPPAHDGDSPARPAVPSMSGNAGGGAGGRSGSGGLTAGGTSGRNPPEIGADAGAPIDMTDEDAGTR